METDAAKSTCDKSTAKDKSNGRTSESDPDGTLPEHFPNPYIRRPIPRKVMEGKSQLTFDNKMQEDVASSNTVACEQDSSITKNNYSNIICIAALFGMIAYLLMLLLVLMDASTWQLQNVF